MSIASIAVALVYFLSFVAADHLMTSDQTMGMTSGLRGGGAIVPVGVFINRIDAKNNKIVVTDSKIRLSKSDRVQLADTLKEMMANNQEAGTAGDMSTEDIFGLLTRVATTPGVLSNAAGIISAARSGDTSALAGHVVGLLGAAVPAAISTPAPIPAVVDTPAPVAAPMTPYAAPAAAPMAPADVPTVMTPTSS
ncbi:hypothetical protein AM588_10011265 [Phytophthora nicotianae]|uniref:Uncharacterized protein n=1 Tax=Phytophthora nicotianae TaxID=4792 RepID=A0A0W8DAR4_PHYNI|nr:hypothetical protein AM588_10011265 [Phytophthora nicotianae]